MDQAPRLLPFPVFVVPTKFNPIKYGIFRRLQHSRKARDLHGGCDEVLAAWFVPPPLFIATISGQNHCVILDLLRPKSTLEPDDASHQPDG